jgi:hypothetical protein
VGDGSVTRRRATTNSSSSKAQEGAEDSRQLQPSSPPVAGAPSVSVPVLPSSLVSDDDAVAPGEEVPPSVCGGSPEVPPSLPLVVPTSPTSNVTVAIASLPDQSRATAVISQTPSGNWTEPMRYGSASKNACGSPANSRLTSRIPQSSAASSSIGVVKTGPA